MMLIWLQIEMFFKEHFAVVKLHNIITGVLWLNTCLFWESWFIKAVVLILIMDFEMIESPDMTFRGELKERAWIQRILITHAMAADKLETRNQKPNPERDFMLMNDFSASGRGNRERN